MGLHRKSSRKRQEGRGCKSYDRLTVGGGERLPVQGFVPQLLLFDVMLPDMDGPQTFGHIKGLASCADVPVIYMTAKAQKHQEQAYLDLGACGVIPKPFDPLTLPDEVRVLWSAAGPL